jgi:predicted MFS family arabinose efflux permease
MSSPSSPAGPHAVAPPPQLPAYLGGTACWFAAFGVQQVLITYLGAEVLRLPGIWFSLAQASGTIPATLLMLYGGAVVERRDLRQVILAAHLMSLAPPLGLAILVWTEQLSFAGLFTFGLLAGVISSFMIPAREAMLGRVAGGAVQTAVRYALLAQFVAQILGMIFARSAAFLGVPAVFLVQAGLQILGAYLAWRLTPAPPFALAEGKGGGALARIGEGLSAVRRSPSLLPVTLMTLSIGIFFVGSFMVILPVILREEFGATVERVSTLQASFWGGTIVSTIAIGAVGTIARKGRLIAIAIAIGCAVLAAMAAPGPLWVIYALTFVWGLGAGVTLTMARTILQEDAPPEVRARVMSVYQLGFSGGMPLGALLSGPLTDLAGGRIAALVAALAMAAALSAILLRTQMWSLVSRPAPAAS